MKVVIAVPAYNEEKILAANINRLADFCAEKLLDDWLIIIADNASSDRTKSIALELSQKNDKIKYLFVAQKGKGGAIKSAWNSQEGDVYIFLDADLAADLKSLPEFITAIKNGFDLALGSRYMPNAKAKRSPVRRIFSNIYRLVLKIVIKLKASDAPCGFKAISQSVKNEILPKVEDSEWFFDSELVILAENQKCKIAEVPLVWQDPREGQDKSRVNLIGVSFEYLRHIINLKKRIKNKI